MAAVEALKEALQLRRLIKTFGIIQDSVQIHCDSQSAIHLAKDHMYHKKSKHIDVRYHKMRQQVVDDKVIDLMKISKKKSSGHDDEDHPGGKVHQDSPKVRRRTRSQEGTK